MNRKILEKISSPEDLHSLSIEELKGVADEVRHLIIDTLSKNGGHLASNLGVVELTIALHKVFSSPKDKILFDTSHQTYTHKILTGRGQEFPTLRKYLGLSGFSHASESIHDHFFSGHAGCALSEALGLAQNRDIDGRDEWILPIIGDASLTCGLTFEALNNFPKKLSKCLILLNDNGMAISKNVGNIKNILSRMINSPVSNRFYQMFLQIFEFLPFFGPFLQRQFKKVFLSIKNFISPAQFFEHFGMEYVGPLDGHDIKKLVHVFESLKNRQNPVLVHVLTKKGMGMETAQKNPTPYHGAKPFDKISGEFSSASHSNPTFSEIFGKCMEEKAKIDPLLRVISPAMLDGAGLTPFKEKHPKQCLDVGIAEGHAITYAGALAYRKKVHVVVSIYASFLPRALDNIFHDICLQRAPVLIAIDRASLNGPDGTTHHGIYDLSFLMTMPNLTIAQPRDGQTLYELLQSEMVFDRPFCIRYPNAVTAPIRTDIVKKRDRIEAELLVKGKELLIIAVGAMVTPAKEAIKILEKEGIFPSLIDPIFLKPFDKEFMFHQISNHEDIVVVEDSAYHSGFGPVIEDFICTHFSKEKRVLHITLPDIFIEHGSNRELLEENGLSETKIAEKISHFATCHPLKK